MMTSIKPQGYRVLVYADKVKEEYEAIEGFKIVEDRKAARAAINTGTVIALGDLAFKGFKEGDGKPWAEVGDKIFYAKYSGSSLQDPETEEIFVIMNDEDVIATIENKD